MRREHASAASQLPTIQLQLRFNPRSLAPLHRSNILLARTTPMRGYTSCRISVQTWTDAALNTGLHVPIYHYLNVNFYYTLIHIKRLQSTLSGACFLSSFRMFGDRFHFPYKAGPDIVDCFPLYRTGSSKDYLDGLLFYVDTTLAAPLPICLFPEIEHCQKKVISPQI